MHIIPYLNDWLISSQSKVDTIRESVSVISHVTKLQAVLLTLKHFLPVLVGKHVLIRIDILTTGGAPAPNHP